MDPFIGEIRPTAFNFAPKGWALCNGQLIAINTNQALFAILGTQYGGDGRTNFALPDLRGRTPLHRSDTQPVGQSVGEATHTLTAAELPAHRHILHSSSATAQALQPTGNVPGAIPAGGLAIYAGGGGLTPLNPQAVQPSGGGQPHENAPPWLGLNFIIALQGVFPSRT